MKSHPYLRAYMAGIVVPTLFLLVVIAVDAWRRFYFEVPNQFVIPLPSAPLQRASLFPMAIVPNAWGLWNMLHLALPARLRTPRWLDDYGIQMQFALPMIPICKAAYYLAWKYLVAPLNAEVGIAEI